MDKPDIKQECKTCKNPYCSRTLEERQKKEVQVHLQYGWECEDKEKYLQNDGGFLLVKKNQTKGFEETINNIPLVVDPCKMCKIYKKHDGWFMGEFKKGEWEDGACKKCCWFYDSKFEVGK